MLQPIVSLALKLHRFLDTITQKLHAKYTFTPSAITRTLRQSRFRGEVIE